MNKLLIYKNNKIKLFIKYLKYKIYNKYNFVNKTKLYNYQNENYKIYYIIKLNLL